MSSDVPFELAYRHIASQILEQGLPEKGIFEPSATLVFIQHGKVYMETKLPDIPHLFNSNGGKAMLGQAIHEMLSVPQDDDTKDLFIVVAAEAYIQTVDRSSDKPITLDDAIRERKKFPKSLAHHPNSVEVVSIMLHHRKALRMGSMLITAERNLVDQGLMPEMSRTFGNLTPSAEELSPTRH